MLTSINRDGMYVHDYRLTSGFTSSFLYLSYKHFRRNKQFVMIQVNCRVFLKVPKCLYNSTMHKEQVFYFLYIIEMQKQMPGYLFWNDQITNRTT